MNDAREQKLELLNEMTRVSRIMTKYEPDTAEYEKASQSYERLAKLYYDIVLKENEIALKKHEKEHDKKEFRLKAALGIATIGTGVLLKMVDVGVLNNVMDFESTGIISSFTARNLYSSALKGFFSNKK